jgi:hypothetical protein
VLTLGSFPDGHTEEDVDRIYHEELQHFHLLNEAIEGLGGDPTQLTEQLSLAR